MSTTESPSECLADMCSEAITVVATDDEADTRRATEDIAEFLRRAGYQAKVEAPEQLIGTWLGTYIVPETEGCDRSACVDALSAALREAGFNPARNEAALDRGDALSASRCRFAVYVGITPHEKGQFILY